jgi:hypothetical protein
MKTLIWIMALALQDDPSAAGNKARERALEMRQECATALESVDGVGSVGVGGSGLDYRLLIVVRDALTQVYVRDLIGGDSYGGIRIVWAISAPGRPPTTEPPPQPAPEKPRAQTPETLPEFPNAWNARATDCDIIRDYLKMKPVTHPSGNGKSWVPCQVVRRTTIGPGGGHAFTYTNHRPDCPIRLGRVGEPPWSDNYVAWVFREGITPATGTNFTLPGNPWAWVTQAGADMGSRLPNVREGVPIVPVYVPPYYPYRYWYWRPCYYHWHWHVVWRVYR